jgi:hypothetical protein
MADVTDYRRQMTREELTARIARITKTLDNDYLCILDVQKLYRRLDRDQAELARRDKYTSKKINRCPKPSMPLFPELD